MKIVVALIYKDPKPARELTVEIRDGLKGVRYLNAIDKAVEKATKDDTEWQRWNLLREVS
jgi:hypothetical protein